MSRYLHTMYRITDPQRSRAFYQASLVLAAGLVGASLKVARAV
jgi:catechol 2,3-dioxygenase-like lactoylglutathione lyase family enzyme